MISGESLPEHGTQRCHGGVVLCVRGAGQVAERSCSEVAADNGRLLQRSFQRHHPAHQPLQAHTTIHYTREMGMKEDRICKASLA